MLTAVLLAISIFWDILPCRLKTEVFKYSVIRRRKLGARGGGGNAALIFFHPRNRFGC
jgi:hypothetical protein